MIATAVAGDGLDPQGWAIAAGAGALAGAAPCGAYYTGALAGSLGDTGSQVRENGGVTGFSPSVGRRAASCLTGTFSGGLGAAPGRLAGESVASKVFEGVFSTVTGGLDPAPTISSLWPW